MCRLANTSKFRPAGIGGVSVSGVLLQVAGFWEVEVVWVSDCERPSVETGFLPILLCPSGVVLSGEVGGSSLRRQEPRHRHVCIDTGTLTSGAQREM